VCVCVREREREREIIRERAITRIENMNLIHQSPLVRSVRVCVCEREREREREIWE